MPYLPPNKKQKQSNGGLQTLIQAEKLMQIAIMLPTSVFLGWLFGRFFSCQIASAFSQC